jgi:AAA15 family ATPase/GTPase
MFVCLNNVYLLHNIKIQVMILEFKIKNYLSFKDEVTFSFEATSDTSLEDYYVVKQPDGVRVLKMMMVYGANASGKSNLIHAFDFLNDFIHNIPDEKEEETDFVPFKFDETRNQPGCFDLIFYVDGLKFKYSLKLNDTTVLEEKLFYYPGKQPAIIFDRYFDELNNVSVINLGAKIKLSVQAKEAIQLKTLKNTSVFAAYSQVNLSIPLLDKPKNWFRNQFNNSIDPYSSITEYTDEHIRKDEELKKLALEFIKKADFNISNIFFEDEEQKVSEGFLKFLEAAPVAEEEKEKIRREKVIHVNKTIFEHKIIRNNVEEFYPLPYELQSKGTLRYYGLTAPFFQTIRENAFMPIDEIGSALHPLLVIHFLKEFLYKSNQAQLLFTTHNLSLLMEKDILRKDAIWFTEKGKDGSTSLYSMSDFNIRKELSYYNAYKIGKFGGIPNID